MASYQEMDVRLAGLENALMFLMQSIRIKQMVGSPLDPNPLIRELTMLDHYREQLGRGLLEQAGVPAESVDELVEELSRGTDSTE